MATVLLIVLVVALAVAVTGAAAEVPACHPTWEKTGIPREHRDEGSCTIVCSEVLILMRLRFFI